MRGHSRASIPTLLLALATAAATLALAATTASATKKLCCFVGTEASGTSGGLFNTPTDVAVNDPGVADGNVEANGDFYVVDSENNRIQRFNANGSFDLAWGADVNQPPGGSDLEVCTEAANCEAGVPSGGNGTIAGDGTMDSPQGVAVDQDTGNVYVSDRDNARIDEYTANGAFIRSFGFDVDAITAGTEYEVCPATDVCKAGVGGAGIGQYGAFDTAPEATFGIDVSKPDGNPTSGSVLLANTSNRRVEVYNLDGSSPSNFGTTSDFRPHHPAHVAIGADGVVYASNQALMGIGAQIVRYNLNTNSFLNPPLSVETLTGASKTPFTSGLEIDSSTGHLLIARAPDALLGVELGVFEIANPSGTATNPPEPSLVGRDFNEVTNLTPIGLGVNGTNGDLFIPLESTKGGHRVALLNDAGPPPPVMTLNPPENISAHCADVSGTINPKGIKAESLFQVSKNGVTWIPDESGAKFTDDGDGESPVAVQETICGLEANTLYRLRLLGKRPGAPTPSAELSFTTDAVAPEVETLFPQAHTDTTARLTGKLNANNLASSYHFEYGKTTAYGSKAPVPDASASDGIEHLVIAEAGGLKPETTYHYRLVATNTEGTSKGEDVAFMTGSAIPPPDGRAYEMVTPPLKPTRAIGKPGGSVHRAANPGIASLSGEQVLWSVPIFPLSSETAFPFEGDTLKIHRSSNGWITQSQVTQKPLPELDPSLKAASSISASGDFAAQSWLFGLPILENASPTPNLLYTRRDGTGTNGFSNWLDDVDAEAGAYGLPNPPAVDKALFNDDGSWMVRWGRYRGLAHAPDAVPPFSAAEDPSVTQLPGAEGGSSIYLQASPPTGARHLVNECTGTGAESTQIPARVGSGLPTDTIGAQLCEAGSVTSLRGATVGGNGENPDSENNFLKGPAATAMSNDGRRVFFQSPDDEPGPNSCTTATGAATNCPAQLYVRQYDSNHENPVVRWISRSKVAGQQIGLLGRGVGFEGASRDGSIVYFRTNAPLSPDDPNGEGVAPPPGGVTTGTASTKSWDLYQYKLPPNPSEDPANGALTRISGGPSGNADPDTNTSGVGEAEGTATRYISDNGKRAYFLTTSPIAGADTTAPHGGTTIPGGAVGNGSTSADFTEGLAVRNLYLFDENASGSARYKFIAKLDLRRGQAGANCAAIAAIAGPTLSVEGYSEGNRITPTRDNSCFRGTPDGDAVVFETYSQLTADDTDNALDIYLYDARTDELSRISAPPSGVAGYGCEEEPGAGHVAKALCNGDLGFQSFGLGSYDLSRGWGGGRNYNIAEDSSGVVSVFFESRSALVPQDTNSGEGTDNYWDTYEWREGKLSLISPGDSENDAYYTGNSLDGHDVFFQTAQRIDPREIDPSDLDIYDARIGGGIPYEPPTEPCDVLKHECRGEATTPPSPIAPASGEVNGPGNPAAPKPCAKGKTRKQGRCVKAHHKRKHKKHHRAAGKTRGTSR